MSRWLCLGNQWAVICLVLIAHGAVGLCSAEAEPDRCESLDSVEDHFSGIGLDRCVWTILHENWGGKVGLEDYNGGVVPENVTVRAGMLRLRALGDQYRGKVRGVGSDRRVRPHGRRTGAAISTRQLFLGGTFEARVRIARMPGVCSAMWTFFLDEQPNKPTRNHEIDIEFPGRKSADGPPSLQYAAFTTWTGLQPGESSAAYGAAKPDIDGFYKLRFDWRPPEGSSPGYVKFYVNGTLMHETSEHVPSEPAPFLIGVWFPKGWAGDPNFDEVEMLVQWVRISPHR